MAQDWNGRIFSDSFPGYDEQGGRKSLLEDVLILFSFHYEYWAGLISRRAVVNPLHLQRQAPRDSGGAALWSSAVKSVQLATLFLVLNVIDLHLLHRLCMWGRHLCLLWICKHSPQRAVGFNVYYSANRLYPWCLDVHTVCVVIGETMKRSIVMFRVMKFTFSKKQCLEMSLSDQNLSHDV